MYVWDGQIMKWQVKMVLEHADLKIKAVWDSSNRTTQSF